MKKFLVAGVALLGWGSALSAPVTPDPAELPGGLSGKNVIHDSNSTFNGQTITNALGNINTAVTDAQTTANAAIPLAQKGEANGVASLDGEKNVTSPVVTPGQIISQGTQQFGISPSIPVLASDAGSQNTNSTAAVPLSSQGFAWNQDGWQNPSMLMLGGKQPFQNAGLSIYGAPYSYSNTGTLLDIEMTNGVWAGNRSGSGDFDAIGQFIRAGNTTPYYKIGEDFTDDTGAVHTLTFDKSGVTVTPALPTSFFDMWNSHGAGGGPGMLLITNMEASAPSVTAAKPGWPERQTPNLWHGYVTGYTSVAGGTHLDMANGWHSTADWQGTSGSQGSVPDTSVGLDQVLYSNYTHPILIMGTYMQAFDQNLKCSIDMDDTSVAAQGTRLSRNDSPVQSCQGNELDVYVPGQKPDGWMHVQGFTADLLSVTPLVSPDSIAFVAQGNWPTAYSTGLGTDGKDFFGGVLDANSRRGPADTIGSTTEIIEAMQGGSTSADVRSNMVGLRMTQHVDTLGEGGIAGIHYPADNSIHLGEWQGGVQYGENGTAYGDYGTYKGDLVFNPGWLKGGIALCGSVNSYENSSNACVGVATGGQMTINPNQTTSGIGLNIDPSGFSGGAAGSAALGIGTVPSDAATAIGVYLGSGYGNNLEEIEVGGENRRSLDASGNETLYGNFTVGKNITVKNGSSIVLYSSDGIEDGYMYVGTDNIEHHSNEVEVSSFVSDGNVAINSGKAITFHGSTGASTSPYLYGSDAGVLTEAGTFVTNGLTSGSYTGTDLTGTGNAYACVNASGQLYRSATACN